MSADELRKILREELDTIKDEKKLERMLNVAREADEDAFSLTDEQVTILKERERTLASGEAKLIPWEEVDRKIKAKHGF